VRKDYQNKKIDTSQPAVSESVSVALTELAGELCEGLLALAVGTGLQVMTAMMEADVSGVCGPKGRHDPARTATRHGHGAGSVTLGGRRVPVTRPRMRALDGSGELAVLAYELFSDTEILGRMAMERMLAGLSTRRYRVGLEPVGARTEQAATATSKSAVSRRFVAATETALVKLLGADLTGLDVVALMVDGVHFGEHCAVVALGIDIDGVKHPLSLVEGSTENATLVTELLVGLRERGLDVTRPILTVLDGSKALRRAVLDVFDHPVIARCQLHKLRNVQDRLPQKLRSVVAKRMRAAYHARTALGAQAELQTLAGELERTHPGAAASLREGLPRDPDRPAPGCAAHPGPHPAQHQLRGKHDRNLSGSLPQRQTLAGRNDGAALVRRRHGRSRQTVPPGQRSPPLTSAANRSRTACRGRKCQSQRAQSHQQRSLMITGPPPKIYEVRDILALVASGTAPRKCKFA
jgi:transposase-like protein